MWRMIRENLSKARSGLSVIETVLSIVAGAILIVIGAIILGYFQDAVPTLTNTAAQTAIVNTFSLVWNIWPLVGMVLLVIVGGAFLSILLYTFARRGETV